MEKRIKRKNENRKEKENKSSPLLLSFNSSSSRVENEMSYSQDLRVDQESKL